MSARLTETPNPCTNRAASGAIRTQGRGARGKNRLHLDLNPVGCSQVEEPERLISLGARRVDVGQGEVDWIVLADPEGNEFCLLRPPVSP